MPAPYVIAHMRLSQQLARYSVTLRDNDPTNTGRPERAAVYLTNALTNWHDTPPKLPMPELQAEQDAAQHVKKYTPILVILGNPPYSAFVGTSQQEEGGLIDKYKDGLNTAWGIRKFNLDDLYVRFYRVAERKIAEGGRGIVSFISPYSYLSDPSFVVMRCALLAEFDHLAFDNLNGDSRETGKRTPDGQPDPSIFSTPLNRAGIRSGTAISLLVKTGEANTTPQVQYREFWGAGKTQQLLSALQDGGPTYAPAAPAQANRFSFTPEESSQEYQSWPKVVDLAEIPPFNGPIERRGLALIDFDKSIVEDRLRKYFDPSISNNEVSLLHPKLMMTGNRIVGEDARRKLLREHEYNESNIVRYMFKPFDDRYAYLANIRPLFSEPSPKLLSQRIVGNCFFITRDAADSTSEGAPFNFSSAISDYDSLGGHARHFPIMLITPHPAPDGLFGHMLFRADNDSVEKNAGKAA